MRVSLPALVLVIAVALSAACGAPAKRVVRPAGEQGVAGIELVGVSALDHDDLIEGMVTERARRDGQSFEPAHVRTDRDRLISLYARRGYFAALVESDVIEGRRGVTVRFRVTEGPRATLAGVEIDGLPPELTYDDVRRTIPLANDAPFDYAVYDLAKPELIALLEAHGYAHGRVDAWVDASRARAQATIRLTFAPGVRARFGTIGLLGVDGKLATAARARFLIREGEPYSSKQLVATQNTLRDMGRFASVRVEPDRSAGLPAVPVTVSVLPTTPRELRLGGGFGLDRAAYQVRARAGYSIAGFPEALTSSRIELRPAVALQRADGKVEPRIDAVAGLDRIDLWRPRLRGEAEAGFSYEALEAYTAIGPRLRLGLRSPIIGEVASLAIGWELRVLRFEDVDEAIEMGTEPGLATRLGLAGDPASDDFRYRLGFFSQTLIVDLRDNPVAPRTGGYAELRLEEGTALAGSAIDYLRAVPELRGYVSWRPLTLAARVRYGVITGQIPVTRRLFAGGAYSQRGFPERRLAPTATAVIDGTERTAVYGGGAMVEAGAEVRARLGTVWKLRVDGATFLDGADVTERHAELDLTRLHWAAGAGLRIPTVVGAVRVDVGVRLNRLGAGELRAGERIAYHLSLGEAF